MGVIRSDGDFFPTRYHVGPIVHGLKTSGRDHVVVLVDSHNFRNMLPLLVFRILSIAANDHEVADVDQSRCSTVEANDSGARFAADRVSRQAIAVVDVENVNLFPFDNVGRFHELWIDRHAAFVVQAGVGHGGSMNLRFKQSTFHGIVGSPATT